MGLLPGPAVISANSREMQDLGRRNERKGELDFKVILDKYLKFFRRQVHKFYWNSFDHEFLPAVSSESYRAKSK